MRAITLYQPYATFAVGSPGIKPIPPIKNVETRSWPCKFTGEILIHAAKEVPHLYIERWNRQDMVHFLHRFGYKSVQEMPRGGILGKRTIIRVERTEVIRNTLSLEEQAVGDYTVGRFAWVFAPGYEAFDDPIPARGFQKIWDWNPEGKKEKQGELFG